MAPLRGALACALAASVSAARCPPLPPLRSPAVKANFTVSELGGLWYENRYTDPAQIGASCQRMNKTGLADGSIRETYEVYYGDVPFPLPLVYNATTSERGVFSRYMSLAPFAAFPSVVVDFDAAPGGSYSALVEYLCWDAPLNITYIEFRISTREAAPSPAYLDSLVARARALGVNWTLPLHDVNFTGCPAWNPKEADSGAGAAPPQLPMPRWAEERAALLRGGGESAKTAAGAAQAAAADGDVILPGIRPGLPQLAVILIQASAAGPCLLGAPSRAATPRSPPIVERRVPRSRRPPTRPSSASSRACVLGEGAARAAAGPHPHPLRRRPSARRLSATSTSSPARPRSQGRSRTPSRSATPCAASSAASSPRCAGDAGSGWG